MINIILATIGFSLFDYIGYNWMVHKFQKEKPYRIIQAIVQILITALLLFLSYEKYGFNWKVLIDAGCFILLWITWCCDWIFYFFYDLLPFFKPKGYCGLRDEVFANKVSWAWWTIYGLLFTKKGDIVNWKILVIQSLIGIISVVILNSLWIH